MTDKINDIEKQVDNQIRIKKMLKNVGWYNFGAYFLYGYAVALSVYTPRWDIGVMIACVGFGFTILSWKNMNLIEKLSK